MCRVDHPLLTGATRRHGLPLAMSQWMPALGTTTKPLTIHKAYGLTTRHAMRRAKAKARRATPVLLDLPKDEERHDEWHERRDVTDA